MSKKQTKSQAVVSKRAVLYARVSTDEQGKHGTSLKTQLDACRRYAKQAGFDIVAEFQDNYTGTVPIESRPGGRKAYELLTSGEGDALIVYSVDRLVRPPEDGDEWDIPILVRSLAKAGCEIHTVERGQIETSFAGLLMAVLDGKSAGDERRKIIERSTRGKREKAKTQWVGISVPFGYRKVGKKQEARLEIDSEQAAIVRRIFAMYLGLDGEARMGFDSIAQRLNAEGVPSPNRNNGKMKRWHASTVDKILANRVYIGELSWCDIITPMPHLAIIDAALFERAQEQRKINKNECTRNTKHEYLLRNWLTCTCGRRMSCIWVYNNGKAYLYYQCNRKGFDKFEGCGCDGLKVRADIADAIAWGWLAEIITEPDKMKAGLEAYEQRQANLVEPKRRRLAELPKLIAETEKSAARLAESLERVSVNANESDLAVKTLEAQLKQISGAHKRYTEEQARLTAEIESLSLGAEVQRAIMSDAAEIRRGITSGAVSFQARRLIAERLKLSAAIEYQDGIRGLRLRCVFESAWRPLDNICNQSLSSDSSFQPHVRSISYPLCDEDVGTTRPAMASHSEGISISLIGKRKQKPTSFTNSMACAGVVMRRSIRRR